MEHAKVTFAGEETEKMICGIRKWELSDAGDLATALSNHLVLTSEHIVKKIEHKTKTAATLINWVAAVIFLRIFLFF